ncbi:FAD-binding oxidoreductase [Actinocorallia sp. A-T 12471]|uniref:FAD-binding oxidoreductase n=1 Tax=Actinocorallia sp. A-T 12471 TaxID=3089813 RepID=UPI0029CE4314|nr:FAD-binding oxidoreductase [Actinocorallia sp. A-T 12471]MDX6740203.1 FAD-binding oxidoreductase [Actinocorallia sp. A-T 12471]
MNVLNTLRSVVRGRVWLPGEPGFDQARKPWNRAVEQHAEAVVEAADAADVAALVRFVRGTGLRIAVQPNGHGATGRTEGAIVLRTGRLDAVSVDPVARVAWIGAGVPSGRLQEAAAPHGLTGLPGSSPIVSVAGVALGGGLSWFGRKYGWVADSVRAFDVVDAEGRERHITHDSDPDLFWALRGGGGDFAVVTALELTLHPAPHLYGGRILWPAHHAPAVMDAFRHLTESAPPELTLWLDLLHFPGSTPKIALDITHLGPRPEAESLLTPLKALPTPLTDTRRPMQVSDVGSITAEPTTPGPGISQGELLTTLDDVTAKTLLTTPLHPLLTLQIRHLGAAFTAPSDSPHGPLTAPYALYMFGTPTTPQSATAITTKQTTLAASLPTTPLKPLTYLNPTESLSHTFPTPTLTRLRTTKSHHDPTHLFQSNHPTHP